MASNILETKTEPCQVDIIDIDEADTKPEPDNDVNPDSASGKYTYSSYQNIFHNRFHTLLHFRNSDINYVSKFILFPVVPPPITILPITTETPILDISFLQNSNMDSVTVTTMERRNTSRTDGQTTTATTSTSIIASALATPSSSASSSSSTISRFPGNTSRSIPPTNPPVSFPRFQPPTPGKNRTYKHAICTLVESNRLYPDQKIVTELPMFTSYTNDGFPFNTPHYTRIQSPITCFPSVNFIVLVNTLMNYFGSQYSILRPAPSLNYFNFWTQIPLTNQLMIDNLVILRSLWWVLIYSNYIPSSQPLHNLYLTLKNDLLSSLPTPLLPLNLRKIMENIAQKTHSNWSCSKSFTYQLIMDRLIVGETGRFPSWNLPDWYGK